MHMLGTSDRPDLSLAVVIGAGTMGMAVARRLAQRHRVLLADIDGAKAEQRAAAMREEGCDARGVACDVTDVSAVQALAGKVAELGGLGVLAHVAGLSPSLGDYATIIRVNLTGVALVAGALLPHARQGSAAILIASLAAHNNPVLRQRPLLRQRMHSFCLRLLSIRLLRVENAPRQTESSLR